MIIAGLIAALGMAAAADGWRRARGLALRRAAAGRLVRESAAAIDRSRDREARGSRS